MNAIARIGSMLAACLSWAGARAPHRAARVASLMLGLGLAVAAGPAVAASDAQAQLEAFASQVQAATGHFQQETQGQGASGRLAAQSGRFAFQRPGRFRWQTLKPHEQLIVSDGQRVFQYDPDLEQVTERQASQAIGASPAALLFGSGSLADAFELQAQPAHDGLQWLRAVPRSPDAGFVHVDIGLADNVPQRLELLDAFGQVTRITFSELQVKDHLPDQDFQFAVPEGATLVRMN